MLLLSHNPLDPIEYTCIILNFAIFAQYILHDNKMLHYMKYTLYKLEKTRIALKYLWLIDLKLY